MPKVFAGPGPNNTTVLLSLDSDSTTNSVPRAPRVPEGILTSKLSGFLLLICPVINFTVPDLTFETKDPSWLLGSYINSSIVNSVSSPSVNTVWSKNNIWAFDCASEIIVSP